ncbi:MAG TPA: hypothetical protein VFK32_07165 [Tepidiformaceae bacterium]|nr:hypothetical protein [Tepidiformaceae bacterium]
MGEAGFPLADGLEGDGKPTQEEQLRDVTQAELVTEAPEDGAEDDVGGLLEILEQGTSALIEAVPASPADEAGVAEGGRALPLRCLF